PAAIGAALAQPGRPVVCFTGDGSLLMNIQELATLAEEDLPVKVVLLDNGHLGLVRQQQELFYGRRYHASRFHAEPDFAAIARGRLSGRPPAAAAAPRTIRATLGSRSPRSRARSARRGPVSSACPSSAPPTSTPWCRRAPPTAT